jgi:hypothetical protein
MRALSRTCASVHRHSTRSRAIPRSDIHSRRRLPSALSSFAATRFKMRFLIAPFVREGDGGRVERTRMGNSLCRIWGLRDRDAHSEGGTNKFRDFDALSPRLNRGNRNHDAQRLRYRVPLSACDRARSHSDRTSRSTVKFEVGMRIRHLFGGIFLGTLSLGERVPLPQEDGEQLLTQSLDDIQALWTSQGNLADYVEAGAWRSGRRGRH